jgi:uncharacterized protein
MDPISAETNTSNTPGAPDTPNPLAPEQPILSYTPLDPRAIQLWRISDLIGFGFLLIPAMIAALVVARLWLGSAVLGFIPWGLLLVLAGWWVIWYPPRAHRAWGYRLDDRVLETRSGVWWRVVKLLPLSRLQHVDLRRGPLERAHGLASLLLHTAGTQEATLIIPGLDDAEAVRLRDRLLVAGGDDAV